jgi:tetratricopeptide (TPR) repeat protein
MGQHSAALYFNLGNSYYRLNKVAESIYYFEKAKQLNPKDEGIQVNSAFAQNMTIDAIENLPESQIAQFQKSLFGVFSFSTWSVLTVLLLWVFVGLFLGYLFFKSAQLKRSFFFSAMLVLLVFITSFFVTFTIDQQDKNTQYAILFSDQIDIWSEPNLQGDLLFTLHEGTKVQLLDKLEEWQKIRIANGSEGWIRNASLRKLESAITK